MSFLWFKKKSKVLEKTKKFDQAINPQEKKPRKDSRVENNLQTEWLKVWKVKFYF